MLKQAFNFYYTVLATLFLILPNTNVTFFISYIFLLQFDNYFTQAVSVQIVILLYLEILIQNTFFSKRNVFSAQD